jgi:hypothetical protein
VRRFVRRPAGRAARKPAERIGRVAGLSEDRSAPPEDRSEDRLGASPADLREAPHGSSLDREHKRMLSARRRLLGLLITLAIACGALAVTRMAAWWVVVPPTVMLLGYVPLLRAAAKADAEQRELDRARAAAASASASASTIADRARARAAAAPARSRAAAASAAAAARSKAAPGARPAAAGATTRPGTAAASRAGRPAKPAAVSPAAVSPAAGPAPSAEVIDISASLMKAGEEFYDQYADAKRRAVGDLARSPDGRATSGLRLSDSSPLSNTSPSALQLICVRSSACPHRKDAPIIGEDSGFGEGLVHYDTQKSPLSPKTPQ